MPRTPKKAVETMPFDNDEITELERILDDRYVRRKDCDKRQDEIYAKIEQIQLDTAKIGTKLNLITGILASIGGALVAFLIKLLFGG